MRSPTARAVGQSKTATVSPSGATFLSEWSVRRLDMSPRWGLIVRDSSQPTARAVGYRMSPRRG